MAEETKKNLFILELATLQPDPRKPRVEELQNAGYEITRYWAPFGKARINITMEEMEKFDLVIVFGEGTEFMGWIKEIKTPTILYFFTYYDPSNESDQPNLVTVAKKAVVLSGNKG